MVKINLRLVLLLLLMLIAPIICLDGCDKNSVFSGSKTSNDNQFLVDFDVLNSTVSSGMSLLEGETVETAINIKKGDVDIIVVNENGTVAYQDNDAENSNFTIVIEEAGTYTFSITGFKAEGSVYFSKH